MDQSHHKLNAAARVAQSVACLTTEPEVLGSRPGPATYICISFRGFKKGSCQLLGKVWARSTGKPISSLSLPRKSQVRLADPPDITIAIYRGRKTKNKAKKTKTKKKNKKKKLKVDHFFFIFLSEL